MQVESTTEWAMPLLRRSGLIIDLVGGNNPCDHAWAGAKVDFEQHTVSAASKGR